jgi:hypothetical protein
MRFRSAWAILVAATCLLFAACSDEPTFSCEETSAGGCTCTADADAENNGATCEPEAAALCCKAAQWPEDDTFCECSGTWKCQSSGGSTCACQLGALVYEGVPEVDACAATEGGVCCQFWDTCNCGGGACEEGHTQVATCNFGDVVDLVATYRCETQRGGVQVASCLVGEG